MSYIQKRLKPFLDEYRGNFFLIYGVDILPLHDIVVQ